MEEQQQRGCAGERGVAWNKEKFFEVCDAVLREGYLHQFRTDRIRDERAYTSEDELVRQIALDVEATRASIRPS